MEIRGEATQGEKRAQVEHKRVTNWDPFTEFWLGFYFLRGAKLSPFRVPIDGHGPMDHLTFISCCFSDWILLGSSINLGRGELRCWYALNLSQYAELAGSENTLFVETLKCSTKLFKFAWYLHFKTYHFTPLFVLYLSMLIPAD